MWAFARLPESIGAFASVASVAAGCLVFFFKQKTAYEITVWTGVQTCALPISGHRSGRAQLRNWAVRDERAPAASVPLCPDRRQLHAKRRASAAHRRGCLLSAEAGRTGRCLGAVHRGVR